MKKSEKDTLLLKLSKAIGELEAKGEETTKVSEEEKFRVRGIISQIPNPQIRRYWLASLRDWDKFAVRFSHALRNRRSHASGSEYQDWLIGILRRTYIERRVQKLLHSTWKFVPQDLKKRLKTLQPKVRMGRLTIDHRDEYSLMMRPAVQRMYDAMLRSAFTNQESFRKSENEIRALVGKRREWTKLINSLLIPALENKEKKKVEEERRKRILEYIVKEIPAFVFRNLDPELHLFSSDEEKLLIDLVDRSDSLLLRYVCRKLATVDEERYGALLKEAGLLDEDQKILYPVQREAIVVFTGDAPTKRGMLGRRRSVIEREEDDPKLVELIREVYDEGCRGDKVFEVASERIKQRERELRLSRIDYSPGQLEGIWKRGGHKFSD